METMADRRLLVFHTVARQLSFSKAGESLFTSQPAVVFQIKQLERHFRTPLFERSRNRIMLTPAGDWCRSMPPRSLACRSIWRIGWDK